MLLLAFASPASAVLIDNGTIRLGVNPAGELNDTGADVGLEYMPTANDGTVAGSPAEGWGAGAAGPTAFQARANRNLPTDASINPISFTNTANTALSIADIRVGGAGGTRTLRVTHDIHPAPTTPNLYEITIKLENLTGGTLTDVRYERLMDWDAEPTPFSEFVTVNRGPTPPSALIYSDDDGFADTFPFTDDNSGFTDPANTSNRNYTDKGPSDHGARFTFSFGNLGPGQSREFFLYYGAAGTEDDADEAVSAAALELFSYGQPNLADNAVAPPDADTLADGPEQGKPNTFIWGFRAVGGSAIIPPSMTLTPDRASPAVNTTQSGTATLRDTGGSPVPGAEVVFQITGAHPQTKTARTDSNGNAGISYSASTNGDDAITACLDANSNGACELNEIADTAIWSWQGGVIVQPPPPPPPPEGPQPELGKSVVVGKVSGTVLVRLRGRLRTLGSLTSIPLGTTVDATKGRVRLISAAAPGGVVQTADFYQGQFKVTQTKGNSPITQLTLNGRLSCGKGKASSSQRRRKTRKLWGDGTGRFRTRGRHGAATVRGTRWLTQDRCNSTKFTVRRGSISVKNIRTKKTRTVAAPKSLTVKPKKRKKKN